MTFFSIQVEEISRFPDSSLWTVRTSSGTETYRDVLLAAPFHQTGITVSPELADQIPLQPYVHLHVTLLTTRDDTVKANYLGVSPGNYIPKSILTTQSGGIEPEFNSLSYHGRVRKTNETGHLSDQDEWNVKIFSKHRISDEWLSKAFDHVGWVYRKEVSVHVLFACFPSLRCGASGMRTQCCPPLPSSPQSRLTKDSTT